MVVPRSRSTSAFSVYQDRAKVAQTETTVGAGQTVPTTPAGNGERSLDSRISQSEKKPDLSDSLALALLKADLQVGKRKRKKSSLRTQLFKKKSRKSLPAVDSVSEGAGALKRIRRSVALTDLHTAASVSNGISASRRASSSVASAAANAISVFRSIQHSSADSKQRALHMFEWMMQPVKPSNFFK